AARRRRGPRAIRHAGAEQEDALARPARRQEEARDRLDLVDREARLLGDLPSYRLFRRLAGIDHAGHHRVEPAAGFLERRIHELLDQIDAAAFGVHEQRRGGIAALEAEPPHHLAHLSVITFEFQARLLDLEEIIEQALAADHLDLRHH